MERSKLARSTPYLPEGYGASASGQFVPAESRILPSPTCSIWSSIGKSSSSKSLYGSSASTEVQTARCPSYSRQTLPKCEQKPPTVPSNMPRPFPKEIPDTNAPCSVSPRRNTSSTWEQSYDSSDSEDFQRFLTKKLKSGMRRLQRHSRRINRPSRRTWTEESRVQEDRADSSVPSDGRGASTLKKLPSSSDEEDEYSDCERVRWMLTSELADVAFEPTENTRSSCRSKRSDEDSSCSGTSVMLGRRNAPTRVMNAESDFSDAGEPISMEYDVESRDDKYCGKFHLKSWSRKDTHEEEVAEDKSSKQDRKDDDIGYPRRRLASTIFTKRLAGGGGLSDEAAERRAKACLVLENACRKMRKFKEELTTEEDFYSSFPLPRWPPLSIKEADVGAEGNQKSSSPSGMKGASTRKPLKMFSGGDADDSCASGGSERGGKGGKAEEDEVMSHLMNLCTQLGMGYIEPDMASWGLPLLATNVKVFAHQLDSKYPEEMDNAFVVLRNACCDVRFPVNCRFRFLELVELRARRWNQEGGANRFYSTMASHFQQQDGKQAMSENTSQQHHQQQQQPSYPSRYNLSHSLSAPHLAPMMLAAAAAAGYQHQHQHQRQPAAAATHQSSLAAIHAGIPLMTNAFNANAAVAAQLTPTGVPVSTSASAASLVGLGSSCMLGHGEVIRGSGKYPSGPFRVPGKNYFRDEVMIRNSDSGKVMGIKGRRVHMIEQLSETVISFQRVAPGTKDRLVQITGPSEESVCRAKQLIEQTICRNSSPMQSDNEYVDNGGADGNSVCSTTDDEDEDNASFHRKNLSRPSYDVDVADDDDYAEASYTVTVSAGPKQSLRMTGKNLKILNASKLILEEIFSVGKGRNGDVDMAEVDKIVESVGKLKDFLLNIRKPCKKMSTRVYSREFLLERAKHQLSMVTPDCLPWLAENVPVIVRQDFVWCPRDEERQAPSGRDDQSSTESESEEELPIPAPIAKQISSKDIHVKASNHGINDKTKKVEHHEQEAVSVRKKEAITVPPSTVAGSSLAARPRTMVARTVAAATRTTSGGVNVARSPARPRSIAMGASASAKSPTSSTAEALAAKVDAILQRRPTSSSSAAGRPECRPYAARRSVTFRAPATKTPTTTDN